MSGNNLQITSNFPKHSEGQKSNRLGGKSYGLSTLLSDYGIQNEESDLRVHVSVCNATVYAFPTQNGVAAIEKNHIAGKYAYTKNLTTAYGYPVPFRFIKDLQAIKIPQYIFMDQHFMQSDEPSEKGNKAVNIVTKMIDLRLIAIPVKVSEVLDKKMQIKGVDILASALFKVQVKCDWRAGETGNLFLQTAEHNPYKQY